MSESMVLELADTISMLSVIEVLKSFGECQIRCVESSKVYSFFFAEPCISILARCSDSESVNVLAEDYADVYEWKVGVRIYILDKGILRNSWIKELLQKIILHSSAAFILTYDYTKTYATRAEGEKSYCVNGDTPGWLI